MPSPQTDLIYNLLVTSEDGAWDKREQVLRAERFLEYTADDLRARFRQLDDDAIETLTSVPTLFAYERHLEMPAVVGWLTRIEPRQRDIRICFERDPEIAPVAADTLQDLKWPLKLEELELNRTHWAVKEADLLEVIRTAPTRIASEGIRTGQYRFERKTLIGACDILATLTHADLDRFLLELGIDELDAGPELGSRRKRANAIADYVLSHQQERTANGEPLNLAVVRKAAKTDFAYPENRPDIDQSIREGFRTALTAEGFSFEEGQLVAATAPPVPQPPYVRPDIPASPPAVRTKTASRRARNCVPQVFDVPDGGVEQDLVAVMMPFRPEFDRVIAAIRSACEKNGLRCQRADDIWLASAIIQDVFSLLWRAHVVVVDFTGKNPNVMYETGIAHTLGKHVVPIAQSLEHVPSDMGHHRVLTYHPNNEGVEELERRLAGKLQQYGGPTKVS